MYEFKTYTIRELIDILNNATREYDKGTPIMTDEEYDNLYFQLKQKEAADGIIYPDSPTQSIHFETVSELKKVNHSSPMLSLDKTKDVKEIEKFVFADKDYWDWFAMFKMDGLTARLTYLNGKLAKAETRGNGEEGEDITHSIVAINSVPLVIPTNEPIIEIDGEIICTYEDFKPFANEYKNPRNFASGSIRQLNAAETALRNLTFVAWEFVTGEEDIDFNFWRLEKLDDWGFITVPRVGDAETVDDAIEYLDKLKAEGIYPIDGYVFKFESRSYGKELGRTDHHWKNAIAFKFYDDEYETELLDIEWSMGRTGILTPVAIFKPIIIDGTEINRANLHNLSVLIETLGREPELHQKVWVFKANQIIPQIARAEKNDTPHDHCLGQHPLVCPICGEPLDVVESDSGVLNVVCTNKICEGKLLYKIEHYCGKKGLDIKGISEKTIEKLIDWGWINGIRDLYRLNEHKADWISKDGFGAASVGKILDAINASTYGVDLSSFISALSIPLVGKSIAKEIVKYYSTWDDFRAAVGGDWTEFEGFGPEISKSINNFDYTEADELVKFIDFQDKITAVGSAIKQIFNRIENLEEEKVESNFLEGKTFVITGKVYNFKNRDELKAIIEQYGGRVAGSVSSKTDYLINNDKESTTSKNKKAKELGIPILTEEEFLFMRFKNEEKE